MKKTEKNGEKSSSSQEKKRFGLQLGEEGVASSIIGGIVEKGFSAPVSQPQVKVVPFPVARHRSHGPHWAPRTSNLSTHDNNEEDDGEDEDHTNFNLLAANAKPIQRKQKKDLNFKQWKELTNDDNTTKKQHKYNSNAKPSDPKKASGNTNSQVINIHKQKASNVGMNDAQSKYENGTQSTFKSNNISEKVMVESKDEVMMDMDEFLNMEKSHNSTSMEREIDAENRARLEKMSSDEIAEAQGEIMKKMNPALIKILQKRGQEKMSKKSSSSIGQTVDRKEQKEKESLKNEQKLIKTNSNHSKSGLESTQVLENKSNSSSLWDAWSTNVENSRDLRFSLDGDVVDDYGHVPGKTSAENAAERDFLRTEGDPGAIGYTIKEALALTRSVVPGQRALALHLLASVLYKAQENICKNQLGSTLKIGGQNKFVDWEALWAFALGPEPELALSLRMCLDDNHNSVVIACAKVIQCVLSFDFNEHIFNISEKTGVYDKDIYTAPIFRNRPKIDVGFLHGGFWKYNTKPSNIFPFEKIINETEEEEHTIKDDIVVATQDILAGLVRMGILPRIRYLLESDPSAALEESLISILVAVARHSPTCADAIMKCERLVQVIAHRFTTRDTMGVDFSKIKSVTLMKVLARSGRCKEFIDNGTFQKLTWHLYRHTFDINDLLNKETEKIKLWSTLLIEQLRFWKVCLQYGYGASYFSDMFPTLFIWLDVPSFEKLRGKNVIPEFLSVTNEAYLVLEALTRTLPNFYSKKVDHSESWTWSNVGPMIDLALKWVSLKTDPDLFTFLSLENEGLTLMLWVISAVFHMLFGVLKSVLPEDDSRKLPWLPDFVPKIGLHIIKNELLSFTKVNKDSFVDFLSKCRNGTNQETKLASVCCLNGLTNVVVLINKLIKLNNNEIKATSIEQEGVTIADKILTDGILESCTSELTTFMKLTSSFGQLTKSIEMFGRGGPAPGVGVGWGASGGGFWSENILVAQMDARLVLNLVEIIFKNPRNEDINVTMERISCIFDLVLLVGPRDRGIMDKSLGILLQPSLLKFLDFSIRHLKTFEWEYTEEEFLTFSENLISHYKNRWLNIKKSKSKVKSSAHNPKKTKFSLDTIQEDVDQTIQSTLVTEWAHQRLPLPNHWFLSSISTVDLVNLPVKPTFPEVSRSGLFFLLGLESISTHVSPNSIEGVPVIWKLHVLSVTLFAGLDILEEEKTRDVYSALQEIYGKILDKKISEIGLEKSVDFLKFDQEIHDSYSTFVETLVENFAGASYGNLLYARQISMYLNRCVGGQIRLATWNALSNIRALELLPPLEKCLGREEGYLEPSEGDEMILEAYVKSWVSGALDKSVTRNSVAFTLVIHHLSCFIFGDDVGDKVSLRNKLAKSVLRDYSRKSDHEGMMVKLIKYKKPTSYEKVDQEEHGAEIGRRLTVLREACEGNSTLLSIVEKLKNVVL